jgi:DNA polymerase (family X)
MSKQTKLFGQTSEPKICSKLELDKANALAEQILDFNKTLCDKIELVGSIRRLKPTVGDIDFVVLVSDSGWAKIISNYKKQNLICSGPQLLKVNCRINDCELFQADFYRATEQTFGILKLIRTGSAEHNTWLAGYAISRGCRLKYSEGLVKDGQVVAGTTEESVFAALGLPLPKPEQREIGSDGKPIWWIKNK